MTHRPIDITAEQRANLRKLADYLLSGDLKADFDMSLYGTATDDNCGTVGCAIGHGPNAGIPIKGRSWGNYADDEFGTCNGDIFCWLFGSSWNDIDNTPQGAGHRILYTLEHGIPNNYDDQKFGESPLCYLPVGEPS